MKEIIELKDYNVKLEKLNAKELLACLVEVFNTKHLRIGDIPNPLFIVPIRNKAQLLVIDVPELGRPSRHRALKEIATCIVQDNIPVWGFAAEMWLKLESEHEPSEARKYKRLADDPDSVDGAVITTEDRQGGAQMSYAIIDKSGNSQPFDLGKEPLDAIGGSFRLFPNAGNYN